MKKFLLIIIVAFFATNVAFSQKVTSKSHSIQITKTKKPAKPHYFSIKAGGGILVVDVPQGMYDVEFGFTKFFKPQTEGLFWGVQLGSNLYSVRNYHGYSENKPALYIGPSIGYQHTLKDNITFSANLSTNLMCVLYNYDFYDDGHWGGLVKLQPGVWFNHFYVGLEGFVQSSGTFQGGVAAQIGYRF